VVTGTHTNSNCIDHVGGLYGSPRRPLPLPWWPARVRIPCPEMAADYRRRLCTSRRPNAFHWNNKCLFFIWTLHLLSFVKVRYVGSGIACFDEKVA